MNPREPVRLSLGDRVGVWTAVHPRLARAVLVVLGAAFGALAGWAFLK